MRTGVPGIIELDTLSFGANYDPTDYAKCQTQQAADLEEPSYYAIWFGGTESVSGGDPTPTGTIGKFSFKGRMTVYALGGGVNEKRSMRVSIAAATPITFTSGS